MNTKVTILDIEKQSGISKTTISRYLRGDRVSTDKARRIEETITALGYVRNNFAQWLRTSKSNLIAVLVPDLDNPFFLKIIKRLDELAHSKGKTLIIKTTQRSVDTELKAIDFTRGFLVEAIFLCRSELEEEELINLRLDIPVISIDRTFESVSSVVSNNYQSSYQLTSHLLSRTSRNLLFFARLHESHSVNERYRGFLDACISESRHSFEYRYDISNQIDLIDLYSYIKTNTIEGIVCRNDNEAVKIMSFLNYKATQKELIPIKVCGFDNIALSNHIIPRLTTVDQRIEEMCDTAFQLYQQHDKYDLKRIIHDADVIIRESTE